MRFRLAVVIAVLWTLCGVSPSPAQFGITFRYTCAEGRFRVSYGKNVWHYCYDGKYYSEKTLPADIRAYFAEMDRKMKESQAKFKQDWAEHERNMERYDAERAAKGLPTRAQMFENAKQRHRSGAYRLTPGGGMSAGGGMGQPRVSGAVEASAKPEAEPVTPEALKGIAAGTSAADLIAALGEPPGKVATGEGVESWTYVLTTGAFAKVKLEAGAVKEVVVPN
ncbi:MAG TPA: hypothetical protein VFB63_11490 [Bryobacteraceae bacterium]|nr:hypothetical protein [Bryobacteraceae bacterium]